MYISTWSSIDTKKPYISAIERPPNISSSPSYAHSIGPVLLNDSQGMLNSRYWLVHQEEDQVMISGSLNGYWEAATALFDEVLTISEISLTFDQLGRPLVFYRTSFSDLKLFWYNPLLGVNEVALLAQGQNPKAGFDLPGNPSSSISDAILFYVRSDKIYMRVQRDRFSIEYETPVNGVDIDVDNVVVESAGPRIDNRFQVVYLSAPPDGFIPPDYIPPQPVETDYRYYYRLYGITYFYLDTPLLTDPALNDIKIDFTLKESGGIKEKGLGFPIYCEGEKTTPYPITAVYDINNGGNITTAQLAVAKRFSLSFMYDIAEKLQLVLVINGTVNRLLMPFDLDDARWSVNIQDESVLIARNNIELFTGEIVRGENDVSDIVYHAKFAAYNMQSTSKNWVNNFSGILTDIAATVDSDAIFFPFDEQDNELQESQPPGNDVVIKNHRKDNWLLKQY